jgi:hypothetical protein
VCVYVHMYMYIARSGIHDTSLSVGCLFLRSPSRVPYRTELIPRAPKGRLGVLQFLLRVLVNSLTINFLKHPCDWTIE